MEVLVMLVVTVLVLAVAAGPLLAMRNPAEADKRIPGAGPAEQLKQGAGRPDHGDLRAAAYPAVDARWCRSLIDRAKRASHGRRRHRRLARAPTTRATAATSAAALS
jgi:hypothetical protein